MLGFKELKDKLRTDENLKVKFRGIKNAQEAVNIARNLGFEVSLNDIENDTELSENVLEAVAGGKGGSKTENNTFYHVDVKGYDMVIDKKSGDIISSKRNDYKL
ncbi:MAG: hypothetical protein RUMPE_01117 [Eubacteriales bacterium SKADARSKE-1]|nr:hypothetical protein [Eubacteriales bacterium SKADARSKE-1]